MKLTIGCDEAGRGAWAGPLVAAAVYLKPGKKFDHKLIRDSKKLSSKQRDEVFIYLQKVVEIGIGMVTAKEIDRLGLQKANVMAVDKAISHLRSRRGRSKLAGQMHQTRLLPLGKLGAGSPEAGLANDPDGASIVIDYIGGFKKYTTLQNNYSLHTFGEQKFKEIAAASIIAKVTRDQMMILAAKRFPHYGFDQHKGYGVARHRKQLHKFGASSIHRQSFQPIRELK